MAYLNVNSVTCMFYSADLGLLAAGDGQHLLLLPAGPAGPLPGGEVGGPGVAAGGAGGLQVQAALEGGGAGEEEGGAGLGGGPAGRHGRAGAGRWK